MRLTLSAVRYRYPSSDVDAVIDVSLTVQPGERVLLTGPTGCGKSTLLRLVAGLLQRHGQGDFSGQIRLDGVDPASAGPAERVLRAGFVSQEPNDQRVSGTVGDELAFAMESARRPPEDIDAALPGLLQTVGLMVRPERSADALSGGQTQRLVTGAALSAGAKLLLLDEPLAQLDPVGALQLLDRLDALAASGVTVMMVEHRLEAALSMVDRILVMADGRLIADAPVQALTPNSPLLSALRGLGLSVPGMIDLADRIAPLTIPRAVFEPPPPAPVRALGAPVVSGASMRYRYPGTERDALDLDRFSLAAGERVAVLGGNGAGKSTLLGMLSGLLPGGPEISDVVMVPQDPDLSLFCPAVREELRYGPQEARRTRQEQDQIVADAAEALSVTALLDRAPQSLSRGQRLRTAIAAALTCQPKVLLLDEPTSGQDHDQIERMMSALRGALSDGALVFATHDVSLALRHATRILILDQGKRIAEGQQDVFAALPPHVPIVLPPVAALCLARGLPPMNPADLAARARPSEQAQPTTTPARPDGQATPPIEGVATRGPKPSRGLDPRARLGLLFAAGILAVTLERPISLAGFAVLCGVPLLWLRVSRAWWRRGLIAVAAIIWSTVCSQGIFYSDQPRVSLGHIGPLHLYREGVVYGLAQSMRFVGLSLAGIAMAVSTPPDRMFAALVKLKVPFGLALMAATALRFLPEIGREALVVRRARAARGRPVWQRRPVAWMAVELSLLRPVIARAWRRAQNLAESLDARGFDPLAERTFRRPLRMGRADWSVLLFAIGVSVSAATMRLLYVLYIAEALYMPQLRPLYGFVRGWL
ncbi:MAG: ATP-binding cassette domain-containing protein [Myxococcota bacterium]